MNRRDLLGVLGAAGVGSLLSRMPAIAAPTPIIARPIPRSGEPVSYTHLTLPTN